MSNRAARRAAAATGGIRYRFQTFTIPPRQRRILLLGASGLTLAVALSVARPAVALNECGAPSGAPPSVTCTTAGNDFPNGIQYQVIDLTIVVNDGVIIDTTGAAGEPGGIASGGTFNYGNLVVQAGTGGGTGITITTDDPGASGIHASTGGGAVTVMSYADISTSGKDSEGIWAFASGAASNVTIISSGVITTSGDNATGIKAQSTGSNVTVASTGDITTDGVSAHGIYAGSDAGIVTVTSAGDISAEGLGSAGVLAKALGSITISSDGDISASEYGIAAISQNGVVTITSSGDISASGDGLHAFTSKGNISVASTGDVSTTDSTNRGIYAATKDGTVTVTSTGNISTDGAGSEGIWAFATGAGSYVSVTSKGAISTGGDNATGIKAQSTGANVDVTSTGDITTDGIASHGIYAGSDSGKVTVISVGDISADGSASAGIVANALGGIKISSDGDVSAGQYGISGVSQNGFVTITSSGDITANGDGFHAFTSKGNVSVISTGDIATTSASSRGIYAVTKNGAATVTSTGDISTDGAGSEGIWAFASGAGSNVIVTSKGAISTDGDNATGIKAQSTAASVAVTSTGNITTDGVASHGIYAGSDAAAVTIVSVGDISTEGQGADGISARSSTSSTTVVSSGDISTVGNSATGLYARSSGTFLNSVTASGSISTDGKAADGILARSDSGNIHVYAQNAPITASGTGSKGIYAISGGGVGQIIVFTNDARASGYNGSGVVVTAGGEGFISVRGDVLGGGGSGVGINLTAGKASQIQILDGASVGALSDVAILDSGENLKISNLGTIAGSFNLAGGNDTLNNLSSNSVDLRAFADTDGDGVRDRESVAIADFGAGTDDFNNTGTLHLSNVSGATSWNTSGQIAHPGGGNSSITRDGIEQGQVLGLETFENSGLITMQDGQAGDLLVITDQTNGMAAGGNIFTSNGGRLALDVELNDGTTQQSDVLVLDKAVKGTGPTTILVANAGGAGGATGTGDGIIVVNARTSSDADAFALGNHPVAGAYQYDLYFQNQAKTDQNWYLRSSFFEGALEYPSIMTSALESWYSDVDPLHERLSGVRRLVENRQTAELPTASDMDGEDIADSGAGRRSDTGAGGWFRVTGGDLEVDQDASADFDLSTVRAEGGFDVGFDNIFDAGDWLVLGGFAGYGRSEAVFDSDSEINFDVATVGTYATYFRGPYYVDALMKLDYMAGDFSSDNVSDDGDVDLPVFGLSLETGYRFDLTQGGLFVQPQLQLSYAHAWGDSFRDDSESEIELEDADSVRGRAGLKLGEELPSASGDAKGTFYAEASAAQEFLGDTSARASGVNLDQELPGTTFEVGGGVDIALPKDGVTLAFDADYIFGDDADGVQATGAIRINW